ncbi:FliH/SctL family protein [Azospirillum rugosum]|uniref:Flagellar assembly protein FliH n=1 Tax=Azospirillum rugosum TaxID=416170 RepID=A0ABS4SVM0_9PROT|nr:FliH/SctL family protein [Azospirillum rugosum]MBP2296002.1 flagellar assembly protein FliH [Azospirillum rugosum]MDQ0529592.1 flagellar assembly protein FliH [Azospirillum rugosum]
MDYPRYRFDQRFDSTAQAASEAAALEQAPKPEAVDPLDVPAHSERALQAAIQDAVGAAELRAFADGLEQGRQEGEAEANARIEVLLALSLRRLEEQLASLDDRFAETLAGIEAEGAAVLVALVRRIAPALLDRVGPAEAEGLARDALRLAGKSPLLRVRVHPDVAEPLRTKLTAAENHSFRGTLDIVADRTIPPGGIDAAWEAGGLRHDPAAVDRAVADLCDRSLAALFAPLTAPLTEDPAPCPH